MKANDLPCLGEEASMYIGGEDHKPDGNFTFEAVLGKDGYYQAFADNPVCEKCEYVINCAKKLMEELCETHWNQILETHITQ